VGTAQRFGATLSIDGTTLREGQILLLALGDPAALAAVA
jgi:hypothetical protein